MKSIALLFLLPLMFAGCQTVTLQSVGDDAAAKHFQAEKGKAKIYVYRLSGFAGAARVEPVFMDGRMLGHNGAGTFLTADVDAGHHTVSTTASSITVETESGGVYFVRQKHSAWGPTSSVQAVGTTEGKEGVTACKKAVTLYLPRNI